MKSLIIDTSHEISYLILTDNSDIVFFKKIEKSNLSKELYPSIEKLLKDTKTSLSKLKYIATSIGPGSFTGLRVSATICKTINYTLKIPIICYFSLQAYTPQTDGQFLSVFDAKSQGIYVIVSEKSKSEIKLLSEPKILTNQDAKKLFETYPKIITPDFENIIEKFKDHKDKVSFASFDPINVVSITKKLYENKKFIDHSSMHLLYLKGPDLTTYYQ